ncbi:MAG: FHA domain-containing protein [Pyrinomonadaceae bacterium]
MKLKIDDREVTLSNGVTTIGRTPDNEISFPEDANVSRHHAEIEARNGEYFFIDLGSSNGSTVNGEKISGEKFLAPGDVIVLGGTSRLEFVSSTNGASPETKADEPEATAPPPSVSAAPEPEAPQAAEAAAGGGSKMLLLVAGGVACIALLFVMIAGGVFFFAGSSKAGGTSGTGGGSGGGGGGGIFSGLFGSPCEAKANITKPETGDTISAATEIEIDVENADCVAKAVFTIDGNEFATAEAPFKATIDPKEFPDLSDGVDHSLGVVLLNEESEPVGENQPVMLAFETRAVTKTTPGPEVTQTNTQQGQQQGSGKAVTLPEVQDMSTRLMKDLFREQSYVVSNKQFLAEVQKRTAEYAQEGYYERAAKYSDAIKVAFVNEYGVKAPLAFILALSRSKFDPATVGAEEGIYRMNPKFITDNGYNGTCGGVEINDPSQSCAAKAAARYVSLLVSSAPGNDPIYSAVVFGKSTSDAAIWFSQIGQNRTDPWSSIKTGQEREQLLRFFAAGIVSENPQKFGLKKTPPLSQLYRNAM